MPQRGLQDSAQGSNPGTDHPERCALIRRYLVAPCWKNTRVRRVGGAEGAPDRGLLKNLAKKRKLPPDLDRSKLGQFRGQLPP
jgi:hypothetical protein